MLRISLQLRKASQNRPVLDPEDLELLSVAGATGPPDDFLNIVHGLSRKGFVGEPPHCPQTLQKPNELGGVRGRRHGAIVDLDVRARASSASAPARRCGARDPVRSPCARGTRSSRPPLPPKTSGLSSGGSTRTCPFHRCHRSRRSSTRRGPRIRIGGVTARAGCYTSRSTPSSPPACSHTYTAVASSVHLAASC